MKKTRRQITGRNGTDVVADADTRQDNNLSTVRRLDSNLCKQLHKTQIQQLNSTRVTKCNTLALENSPFNNNNNIHHNYYYTNIRQVSNY